MNRITKIIIATSVFILIILLSLSAIIVSKQNPIFQESIVIIPIEGTISTSSSQSLFASVASDEKIVKEIEKANKDRNIKAIILSINSGGGSAVASAEIERAIKRSEKPTVALIRDVCASGAYWIASASDKIVADPNSIVGSIGVIYIHPDYSRLFNETLKMRYEIVKGGEYKDMSLPFRSMTEEEKEMWESMVQGIYDNFIETVAKNRKMDESVVREIAEGKLYSGEQAKEIGLVDELGGEKEAIEIAKKLGNIKGKPYIKRVGKRTPLEVFLGAFAYYLGLGIGDSILNHNIDFNRFIV
ncbi:MAG: signal peptide peptidase SppA [Candidatus Hydrothermarchaeota archaeon]